jgi:hypothetical protein
MNFRRLFISTIFTIIIIALVASAIVTVLPDSTASKVCHLGYYAHCTFTPYGTIILIAGAVSTIFMALKLNFIKLRGLGENLD